MELSGSAERLSLCSLSPSRRRPAPLIARRFGRKYVLFKVGNAQQPEQIGCEVNDLRLS